MKPFSVLGGAILALLLGGCATYKDDTEGLRTAWAAGNVKQAAQIAGSNAEQKKGSGTALLWYLEDGATTRADAQFDRSLAAFNQADAKIDYWDSQPAVSVSAEAAAIMVNQTVLSYRGTSYDKIMESTYQALNYLQLGQPDQARVELNRARERQRAAVEANAARIASAQEAAAAASNGTLNANSAAANKTAPEDSYDVQRAQNDPGFKANLQNAYGSLDGLHYYTPYVNPFSVFLEGIYFLARGDTGADLERGRVALNQVRSLTGDNPFINADCDLADKMANGAPLPETTYVIYETGMAPIRDEVRIDIPLFIVSRSVPYVGVAFPQLRFNSQYNPGLIVQAGKGEPLRTVLLCDMDLVIAQEFRNELPVIIVKTLISAGAKAAAQYGLYAATKGNNALSLFAEIGGTLYQFATNRADLRTWVTLPKQFVYCRLPTPADRKLQLTNQGTGLTQTVDLPPGVVTIVYVKSNTFADRLLVNTFTLR